MKISRWLISAMVCWIISISLLAGYSWGGTMDKENWFVNTDENFSIGNIQPSTTILLVSSSGKQSKIDFGGDRVEYSGDLPVSEAAKIFFEAVFHEKSCCEELRKIKGKK